MQSSNRLTVGLFRAQAPPREDYETGRFARTQPNRWKAAR